MLYLTSHGSDFEGGCTRFYDGQQAQYQEGDPQRVTATYRPKAGSALVFNHVITHDGEEVKSGEKYIMRSEIMFKPIHTLYSGVQCGKQSQY